MDVMQVRPVPSSQGASLRMQQQRSHDTETELTIRRLLHMRGYRYRIHVRPVSGLRREADIAFGPAKVAVMVDGCFWHACPEHATWPKSNAEWWRTKIERNQQRDAMTDLALTAAGWSVLRIWEHEACDEAVDRIAAVVDARRPVRRTGLASRRV
jgi:DNA mismatch endonuclease (patch repair protein)